MEDNEIGTYSDIVDRFTNALKNQNWLLSADENTIDEVFNCALMLQNEESLSKIFLEKFIAKSTKNGKTFVDLLLETLLKSQNLNERLTLYAIKKYILLCSKESFLKLLDDLIAENNLRECLFKFNENFPDREPSWFKINNFIEESLDANELKPKILNVLKNDTAVLLSAVKHNSSSFSAEILIKQTIDCLDSQEDLKLWFILMKQENLEILVELCTQYGILLESVLKFFDKVADEIESNYDEDLNVKYSHVNLDFEDFISVFKCFLMCKGTSEVVNKYLDKKISLDDKNFCFWLDVKACL